MWIRVKKISKGEKECRGSANVATEKNELIIWDMWKDQASPGPHNNELLRRMYIIS